MRVSPHAMSRLSTTVSNPGSRRGSSGRQASAHGFRPRFEKYETKKEKAERERAEDEAAARAQTEAEDEHHAAITEAARQAKEGREDQERRIAALAAKMANETDERRERARQAMLAAIEAKSRAIRQKMMPKADFEDQSFLSKFGIPCKEEIRRQIDLTTELVNSLDEEARGHIEELQKPGWLASFHQRRKGQAARAALVALGGVAGGGEDTYASAKETFGMFDLDDSGAIDASELGLALKSMGHEVSDSELQEMLNQYDEDGSGEIELVEFCRILNIAVPETEENEESDEGVPWTGSDADIANAQKRIRSLDEKAQFLTERMEARFMTDTTRLSIMEQVNKTLKNKQRLQAKIENETARRISLARANITTLPTRPASTWVNLQLLKQQHSRLLQQLHPVLGSKLLEARAIWNSIMARRKNDSTRHSKTHHSARGLKRSIEVVKQRTLRKNEELERCIYLRSRHTWHADMIRSNNELLLLRGELLAKEEALVLLTFGERHGDVERMTGSHVLTSSGDNEWLSALDIRSELISLGYSCEVVDDAFLETAMSVDFKATASMITFEHFAQLLGLCSAASAKLYEAGQELAWLEERLAGFYSQYAPEERELPRDELREIAKVHVTNVDELNKVLTEKYGACLPDIAPARIQSQQRESLHLVNQRVRVCGIVEGRDGVLSDFNGHLGIVKSLASSFSVDHNADGICASEPLLDDTAVYNVVLDWYPDEILTIRRVNLEPRGSTVGEFSSTPPIATSWAKIKGKVEIDAKREAPGLVNSNARGGSAVLQRVQTAAHPHRNRRRTAPVLTCAGLHGALGCGVETEILGDTAEQESKGFLFQSRVWPWSLPTANWKDVLHQDVTQRHQEHTYRINPRLAKDVFQDAVKGLPSKTPWARLRRKAAEKAWSSDATPRSVETEFVLGSKRRRAVTAPQNLMRASWTDVLRKHREKGLLSCC